MTTTATTVLGRPLWYELMTTDTKAAAHDVEHAIGLEHDSLQRVVGLVHADGIPGEDARHLFPKYLEGVERLVHAIDRWPS